jgi:hypothetical protein
MYYICLSKVCLGFLMGVAGVCKLSPNREAGAGVPHSALPSPIWGAPVEMLLVILV